MVARAGPAPPRTGRDKPVPYAEPPAPVETAGATLAVARAGSAASPDGTGQARPLRRTSGARRNRRGDPCGRPRRTRRLPGRDGTSPSPTPNLRRPSKPQGRPLRSPPPETGRDKPVPYAEPPAPVETAGATLAVARAAPAPPRTGRDKPVPYAEPPATRRNRRGDPCGRPRRTRRLLGRDKPVPHAEPPAPVETVGATLAVARAGPAASDGTSPSPTPNLRRPVETVGATLAVARAGSAPAGSSMRSNGLGRAYVVRNRNADSARWWMPSLYFSRSKSRFLPIAPTR